MKLVRWIALCGTLVTASACTTTFQEGSVYEESERTLDLFLEPTLDLGVHEGQHGATFDIWPTVPRYDADGHGAFDVPVVFAEELICLPGALLAQPFRIRVVAGLWIFFLDWSPETGSSWMDAGLIALKTILVPYYIVVIVSQCACFLSVSIFDVLAHDIPVVLVGKPLAFIQRRLTHLLGQNQAMETGDSVR